MAILAAVTSTVALIVSILGIITFGIERRKEAVKEGMHLQEVKQFKEDLARAHEKIRALQEKMQDREVTLAELSRDVKHIVEAVQRIEAKLDEHIGAHIPERPT